MALVPPILFLERAMNNMQVQIFRKL